MSPAEQGVAAEIRRLVREDLHARMDFGDDDELSSRLDSLALLSLVVAVEDRFRILLTDEDAATARSLSDLARIVAARSTEQVAP